MKRSRAEGSSIHSRSFVGVYRSKSMNAGVCWRAFIGFGGQVHCVGRFNDEMQAAIAYDCAAFMLYGAKAAVNFGASNAAAVLPHFKDEPAMKTLRKLKDRSREAAGGAALDAAATGSCAYGQPQRFDCTAHATAAPAAWVPLFNASPAAGYQLGSPAVVTSATGSASCCSDSYIATSHASSGSAAPGPGLTTFQSCPLPLLQQLPRSCSPRLAYHQRRPRRASDGDGMTDPDDATTGATSGDAFCAVLRPMCVISSDSLAAGDAACVIPGDAWCARGGNPLASSARDDISGTHISSNSVSRGSVGCGAGAGSSGAAAAGGVQCGAAANMLAVDDEMQAWGEVGDAGSELMQMMMMMDNSEVMLPLGQDPHEDDGQVAAFELYRLWTSDPQTAISSSF